MLAEGVESAARVAVLFPDLLLPSVRWLASALATREQIGAPLLPVEQSPLSALLHTLRERSGEAALPPPGNRVNNYLSRRRSRKRKPTSPDRFPS